MEEIETIKKGKKILKIYVDEDPSNPREWDNLTKMVLSHKRYNLPNEINLNFNDFTSWEEIEKHIKEEFKAVLVYAVRGYDHSGFSISLCNEYPFNDCWDSGQLGFICVLEDDLKKEFGKVDKTNINKCEKILKGEFESYKNWIEGEIYGYKVFEVKKVKVIREYEDKTKKEYTTEEEEEEDSCWGFFGNEGIKQIKEETGFN